MNGMNGFVSGYNRPESARHMLGLAGLSGDTRSFTTTRLEDQVELNVDGPLFADPSVFTSAKFYSIDPAKQRREESELRRAKEAAEDMIRRKDTFLAMVSHELRAPLTPAFGAIDLLIDDQNISEENKALLEIVKENIEIEMRLVEDLQEMTRLANGKLSLELKQIDAHNVVRKAIAVCMSDFERKNLQITVTLEASKATVAGDSLRLQQVIWNLLKNATKFTPEGGAICISTRNDSAGHLSIEVADTGRGIDGEILPIIFNAFEQGSKTTTRDFGGLGLGLAITKMLVEMHGGQIHASSEGRGEGATFTVTMNTIAENGSGPVQDI